VNDSADWWNDGAAHHMDEQDFDTGRLIATLRDDGVKKPFRWSELSAAQQALLGNATTGPRLLNFVRGDRTFEVARGGTLRDRDSVLGDILHSRPYYLPHADGAVLFVGANDGMLHAIDARTAEGGRELWAYVPRTVMSKLPALAQATYVHTHYVDGGLNVGRATISGSERKVLVSALGAGGRGLFAIDVTNPRPTSEAGVAANVLWEISNANAQYAELGYT
jgi:type IV pilus assembly protein PilY1